MNKIIYIFLLLIFTVQCSSPKYLPLAKDIDSFTYGSHISLYEGNKKWLIEEGEFIALQDGNIYVLTESKQKTKVMKVVPITSIENFELKYAKSSNYTAATVLSLLSVASHYFLASITLPINIIVNIAVNEGGRRAFTYDNKDISMDKIVMFARFPQGIPQGVSLNMIK